MSTVDHEPIHDYGSAAGDTTDTTNLPESAVAETSFATPVPTPVIEASPTERGKNSHTQLKWLAAGGALVTAIGVGYGVAKATSGSSNEHATHPVVATSTPTPKPSSSETTTATASPTTSTANTPEQTPTVSATSSELGTVASVPASFFANLIDKSTVNTLTAKYPLLEHEIDPQYVQAVAEQRGITAQKIAAYQSRLTGVYANKDYSYALGDPRGVMSPSILSTMQKQDIIDGIPQTADIFRKAIAEGIFHKFPGINAGLMDIVSLNDNAVHFYTQQVTNGHDTFPVATHTDEVAVVPYHTTDGADVTILVTVSTYGDGEVLRQYFANVPVGAVNAHEGADTSIAVPFDAKNY